MLLVLMATDPAFVVLSKLDFGPIVVGTFFKLLAVWAFLRLLATRESRYLAIFLGAVALGLFDKVNFIWFVNALAAATLLAFPSALLRAVRHQPLSVRLASGAAAVTIVAALAFLLFPLRSFHAAGLIVVNGDRFREMARVALGTIDGRSMWTFLLQGSPPPPSWTGAVLAASLALLAAGVWRRAPGARFGAFFLVLLAGTLVQVIVTGAAWGPHHMMTFWPWHHMLICLGAAAPVSSGPTSRHATAMSVAGAALLGLVAISQAMTTMAYVRAFTRDGGFDPRWDPAIYALSDAIERIPGRGSVFSVEWGLHTQLQALASPETRRRYHDVWPAFTDLRRARAEARGWWAERVTAPGAVIVIHAPRAIDNRITRRSVVDLIAREDLTSRRMIAIRNGDGRPMYEVHRLERRVHLTP
jgi:hypothetical protein